MTAALLGWPQCTFAAGVAIEGKTAVIDRETDAGTEKIKVFLWVRVRVRDARPRSVIVQIYLQVLSVL